jgi:hypothetical protein
LLQNVRLLQIVLALAALGEVRYFAITQQPPTFIP